VYQLLLKRIQILPCASITKCALLLQSQTSTTASHVTIDPTAEPSTLSAEIPKDKGKNKRNLDDIGDDEDPPAPKATKISTRKKEKRAVAMTKDKDRTNEDVEMADK